jgi:uncharacterized protein (DUF488 family)
VIDVRRYPASRRMPHFSREQLERSLPRIGIGYEHFGELGGRRTPRKGSPNGGWRVAAFRGYADFMATGTFGREIERLEAIARERCAALMCAEALWWRCHRKLIADALVVRGWEVLHIGSDGGVARHALTAFAVVEDGLITYPEAQQSLET